MLAFWARMENTGGVQGRSDPNPELLDAGSLVGHLVPGGSVYGFLAEHRRRLFPDGMFADLFASGRGRPSVPGEVIATVMVLQALEGLSDRDAAEALRTDLRWKVAAGLSLTDEGFHSSVLTLWRNRLRASDAPERIFDAVRDVVAATGVLKTKTRRALDSTLLDDAVATQDTVTQLVSAIRRVRRSVPAAAGVDVGAHDYEEGGKPACAWDDPAARAELVSALVGDALAVLGAVETADLDQDQAQLVGLLALVAGQDVEEGEMPGTWLVAQRVAPDRVISTVDPDARHMHKSRSEYRDGYKAHLAVEPDTGIITACALTAANAGDGPTGVALLDGEPEGLEVLADSAYGSGEVRVALRRRRHRQVIKPIPLRANPRLGPDQFNRDDFSVDHAARTVTCPAGLTRNISPSGAATFGVACRDCELKPRCTSAVDGRVVHVTDGDHELVAARRAWTDNMTIDTYRQHRPMVERSIAWLVANGGRRVRYRGVDRNQLGLSLRVTAINLRRLINLGLGHDGTTWHLS